MSKDFKSSFKSSVNNQNKISNDNVDTKHQNEVLYDNNESKEQHQTPKFKIGKKVESKTIKKSYPLYLDDLKHDKLDKIIKKTNYSKNELITMMIDFCLENLEYDF